MRKKISPIIVSGILFLLAAPVLTAQNSTNSPYTRYGYGDLANRSFSAGRSMGGTGIGLRSPYQINPMNPASYSGMDTLTFLFDFGATAQMSWFSDGTNKQNDINGNVDYMAMQFLLFKKIGFSAGLMPFSHVGYQFREVKSSGSQTYYETFNGVGGLNLLYSGLSIDIWKKRLSVGSNFNYIFGTNTHLASTSYGSSSTTSVYNTKSFKVSDVSFDFGMQYIHPLSKTDKIVVGLTYSPKKRLNTNTYSHIENGSEVVSDTISGLAYDKPAEYGIGFSFVKDDKLTIIADLSFQEWNKITFAGKNNEFKNRTRVSGGFEYIPNLFSRPLLNRMRYRAGVSYTNSYIQINGKRYNEYGATIGAGFPITDGRSFVNVSFEYLKIHSGSKSMINEDYIRMTLSYTFNELWFLKFKMN
jgi:hypothetical protein